MTQQEKRARFNDILSQSGEIRSRPKNTKMDWDKAQLEMMDLHLQAMALDAEMITIYPDSQAKPPDTAPPEPVAGEVAEDPPKPSVLGKSQFKRATSKPGSTGI